MKQELTEKLFKKYEFLCPFGTMQDSLMWFGCEHLDGWYELVDKLSADIKKILDEKQINDFKVVQIKEKFGSIRYYWEGDLRFINPYISTANIAEQIHKLVTAAEEKSGKICERCGKKGKIYNKDGWLMTRCPSCWKNEDKLRAKERAERMKDGYKFPDYSKWATDKPKKKPKQSSPIRMDVVCHK